jgi:hypothetical protein
MLGSGILLISICSGCIKSNFAEYASAMGTNNATIVGKISSIYGTGYFIRANPSLGQSVTITPDGTVNIKTEDKLPK